MFTSMLLFSVPNVLPVDELLASTVTSVVTASESLESFLFLFGNPSGSETLYFLYSPETLLLCFPFSALS